MSVSNADPLTIAGFLVGVALFASFCFGLMGPLPGR